MTIIIFGGLLTWPNQGDRMNMTENWYSPANVRRCGNIYNIFNFQSYSPDKVCCCQFLVMFKQIRFLGFGHIRTNFWWSLFGQVNKPLFLLAIGLIKELQFWTCSKLCPYQMNEINYTRKQNLTCSLSILRISQAPSELLMFIDPSIPMMVVQQTKCSVTN